MSQKMEMTLRPEDKNEEADGGITDDTGDSDNYKFTTITTTATFFDTIFITVYNKRKK